MTLGLITVNLVVFLLQAGLDARTHEHFITTYALVPGFYTHPEIALKAGVDTRHYLPFLSNTFMHGGPLHLIFNMWTLWLFGVVIEDTLGKWRFLLLYLAAGLAGSLAHMAFNLDSFIPALGASGAIAGVLGAFAVLFPKERVLLVQPIFFFPLVFPLPVYLFTGIWFALQAFGGLSEIGAPDDQGGIAWWAHIGGIVTGGLIAFWLKRAKKKGHTIRRGPWS